jgi:hypothetical protein
MFQRQSMYLIIRFYLNHQKNLKHKIFKIFLEPTFNKSP